MICAAAGGGSADAQLQRGIADYDNFAFDRARAELLAVAVPETPRSLRAKAHVYLGLIAFQQGQTDEGFKEFDRALGDNPTIEPPLNTAPKIRTAFAQARREHEQALDKGTEPPTPSAPLTTPPLIKALPAPQATQPAPQPAIQPTPAAGAVSAPAESNHHVLSWVLGGVGVVATGIAIYGGVEVLNYDQIANSTGGKYNGTQFSTAQSSANVWRYGWVISAAAAAAAFGGAVVTW